MASVCLTERAGCLRYLGRLDEAVAAYEETIELDRKRGHPRDLATDKAQLGTVRMLQQKYAEALTAYDEAREIFEGLGERRYVAGAWHQIGIVHEHARQYDAAEKAYQKALQIRVQIGDRSGEAATLNQLGQVYRLMGRQEDAVRFYRQAVDIYVEFEDAASEGRVRNNAALALITLKRYDEAHNEIERAIECKRGLGHAAEPWKTLAILCDLERAVGNDRAAAAARQKAIDAYLAYRRDGGENLSPTRQFYDLLSQAIEQGQTEAASQALAQLSADPDTHDSRKPLIPALQAILAGSSDPDLAAEPNLNYEDAVELRLLLEELATKGP